MKAIKSACFLKSETDFKNYKGFGYPEIVFAGRSNVGKSSLINLIANNGKLAKVSATQGKTKLVNFFLFNDEFLLVDLPGYGYASAGKDEQERWAKMINCYLENSKQIKCAILLVDIRHTPTKQDIQILDYFTFNNIPVTIVATKLDKIKNSEKQRNLANISATLKVGINNIFVVSAEKKIGRDELVQRIYQFIDGE